MANDNHTPSETIPHVAGELSSLPHVPVLELEPFQGNLKELSTREYAKLKKSILEHGIIVPFFVWAETGKLIDGHQRRRVFENEGWDMPVPVVYISAEDEQDAKRKLLVVSSQYGKITQKGWDRFTFDLDQDWLIDTTYFNALPLVFDTPLMPQFDIDKNAKPNARLLPIDAIYTLQGADASCCLAIQAGLKYGLQSSGFKLCPCEDEFSGRHKLSFIDNDYFNYDHVQHTAVVERFRPKYATVRDIMDKAQCNVQQVQYYELGQILDWAEELDEYADNVIVVPKWDCLDKIPNKFVLGYSIPTSHGGTPLDPELFRGRRVHLLGGSWSAQLAYMALLGDDVVSFDNNYIGKMAQFGQFCDSDGNTKQLDEAGFGYLNNPRYTALALSFGAIGAKINQLYQNSSSPVKEKA